MAEISGASPLPPTSATTRPVAAPPDVALRLLQSLDGLLVAGETARAEVLALREQAQQFQLLLRLTLDNGRQTQLQASSAKPLEPGSALLVTALSDTRLQALVQGRVAPQLPLNSLDLQQLPVGTQIQARVDSSLALPPNGAGPASYRLVVTLLDSPLAGRQLSLDSTQPLSPGSLLSARVEGSQSLALVPLAARLDQLEVNHQLGSQLSRQGSLDALLGALTGLRGSSLPDGLRGAIERLLGSLPDAGQLSTAKGLAQALANSGALLESRLLGGQAETLNGDLKANLLRLIGQLLPNVPGAQPTAAGVANSQASLAQALPALLREALGQQQRQATGFPLASRLASELAEEGDLESLLKLAAAAIARLQTHQLSSLAQTQVTPEGNLLTTWQFEIPVRDQQQMVPLQFRVQSEESADKSKQKPGDTLWRVDLAFDLDPLGPLQVQAQLLRGSLSSQFWAERADTARLIRRELDYLRERLKASGLEVGELACAQGSPPRGPRTALEHRWVDVKA